MSKAIEGVNSAKQSNQQVTITFNLEDPEARKRLRRMLDVDNYQITLCDLK